MNVNLSILQYVRHGRVFFLFLQLRIQAILVNHVAKYLPTNITLIDTGNTRAALTTDTGSSPAHCVTAPLTSETGYAFISFTCMTITALTVVPCAGKPSPNHQALTSICAYTVATDHTSVLTASKPSQRPLFCARTSVNIAERSHSSASIAGACLLRMRRMMVTCGAIIAKETK